MDVDSQGWMEAGLKEGRVYCEVKCSKNPSGMKSSEGKKTEAETQRTDVKGSEGADRKKRAHQELSLRGRRSEREQRREGL